MKKFLLFVLFSFSIFSCKKDPCKDVHCLNGGTCVDGSCNCPGGYSGPRCENFDPCFGVTCLNGGVCVNGICDCPPGYGGPDCGTALTPVQVKITKVAFNSFPLLDNYGAGWDYLSGPDILMTINPGTSANGNAFVSSYYYPDEVNGHTFTSIDGLPYTINTPGSNWTIALWDYDNPDPSDYMGGFYFTPNNEASGFPTLIHFSGGGGFDVDVFVEWIF